MNERIALCIDDVTSQNPELIGLDGESLESQGWLDVYALGQEARDALAASEDIREAWVVSAEDVEPINLAATLKADSPDLRVVLVDFDGCGSLHGRAQSADIDEVMERSSFIRRYGEAKRHHVHAEGADPDSGLSDVASFAWTRGEAASRKLGGNTSENGSLEAVPIAAGSAAGASPASPVVYLDDAVSPRVRADEGEAPEEQRIVLSEPARQPLHALAPSVTLASTFLLPVVSGSGGAGKSAVAVVAAFMAQRMGYKTLLLDYDLQFGDMELLSGRTAPLAIDEAIAYPDKLVAAAEEAAGPLVVAAPDRLEDSELVVRSLPDLLETADGLFDVVVANTGAAWAEQHAVLLERCNAAIFLVDQRASSVRACKHALALCGRCSIATGPFRYVVNRCAKGAPLTSIDVSSVLDGAPVFELKDGGRDVEDYLSGGAVSDLLDTRNDFCASVLALLEKLLPDGQARAEGLKLAGDDKRPVRKRGRHGSRKRKWGAS